MKKYLMIAGAAAMAVTMPVMAKPDKGQGGGNPAAQGGGGGKHGGHGGGGGGKHAGQGGGGGDFKPQKMGGGDFKPQKMQEQRFKQAEKAQKQQFRSGRSMKDERKQAERFAKEQSKQQERAFKQRDKQQERFAKQQEKMRDDRVRDSERFRDDRVRDGDRFENTRFGSNSQGFCPPGLAMKNNGCLPPGQAKKMDLGQRFQQDWFRSTNLPYDYRNMLSDNDRYYYRYDNQGYIYRVDRSTDLVSGLIPLLGGGFQVGQVLPAGYDVYNVPLQYRDQYFDTDDLYYRYGDNAIYQVDPQTQMIQSVVALLTGNNFDVGQRMPAGYDMYNVPLQYRDQYYDTDQYNYRYADGNIYQIDPTTQIVQAIISALI